MPLLNDAKSCYVGNQPITKIYAGTQFVWGALNLRLVEANQAGTTDSYLFVAFEELENCADCAEMQLTYQTRWGENGSWDAWVSFKGYRASGAAYSFLGPRGAFWEGKDYQVRINGAIETLPLNQDDAPFIGNITPDLDCL